MTHRHSAVRGSGAASFAAAQHALFRFASLSSLFRRSRALLNPPGTAPLGKVDFRAHSTGATINTSAVAAPRSTLTRRFSFAPRLTVKALAVTTFAALGMQSAFAWDIYVDGKYGSDNNNGSRYSAYKTVRRAWSAANAGDTVHLLPTTTYGYIWLSGKSGYAGKTITLKGGG